MAFNVLSWSQEWARGTIRDPMQHLETRPKRSCPCCGFEGLFVSGKRRAMREMRCPNCKSRPRDRLLALVLLNLGIDLLDKNVLHFAPEWPLFCKLRRQSGYVGGDIQPRRNANAIVDITAISFPDKHFDHIVCNHVLEHVPDDRAGIRECHRVLKHGGSAFFSVPIEAGREETWEPPAGMPPDEVERICGWDHKRLYGMDFARRLSDAGFSVAVFPSSDEDMRLFRLEETDAIFVATA